MKYPENRIKWTMNPFATQNVYHSPKKKIPSFFRKAPGWIFYPKMISIVWKASKLSKKGTFTGEKWIEASLGILRALESVGARFHVENLEAFKNLESPCVFVGNHMSTLETFIFPSIIQPFRNITFVVKKSLIEYPVFKHIMISRDPIVVGRIHPRDDLTAVLEGGVERLRKNISIVVFPQTTRSTEFHPKQFNTIGVKLAQRAKVPIVPFALRTDAWGNGKWIKDFGKIAPSKPIHICFGDPLTVLGTGKKQHKHIVAFIQKKLASWSSTVSPTK